MVTGYAIVLAFLIPFPYSHRKPTNSIFSARLLFFRQNKNEVVLIAHVLYVFVSCVPKRSNSTSFLCLFEQWAYAGRISDRTLVGWMEKRTLGSRGPVTCINTRGAPICPATIGHIRAWDATLGLLLR